MLFKFAEMYYHDTSIFLNPARLMPAKFSKYTVVLTAVLKGSQPQLPSTTRDSSSYPHLSLGMPRVITISSFKQYSLLLFFKQYNFNLINIMRALHNIYSISTYCFLSQYKVTFIV